MKRSIKPNLNRKLDSFLRIAIFAVTILTVKAQALGGPMDYLGNAVIGRGLIKSDPHADHRYENTTHYFGTIYRARFLKESCVTGDSVFTPAQQAALYPFENRGLKSLRPASDFIGFNLKEAAQSGAGAEKAIADFLMPSATSLSALFSVSEYWFSQNRVSQWKLTKLGEKYVRNAKKWKQICGNQIVEATSENAKLFAAVRLDFSSAELKQKYFPTNKEWWFSSLGEILNNLENGHTTIEQPVKDEFRVTLTMYQQGGDAKALDELFGNPERTFSCSSLHPFDCVEFFKKMSQYAWSPTKGFGSQIGAGRNTVSYPSESGDAELVRRYFGR